VAAEAPCAVVQRRPAAAGFFGAPRRTAAAEEVSPPSLEFLVLQGLFLGLGLGFLMFLFDPRSKLEFFHLLLLSEHRSEQNNPKTSIYF